MIATAGARFARFPATPSTAAGTVALATLVIATGSVLSCGGLLFTSPRPRDCRPNVSHRRYKAVTTPRESFHILRTVRGIVQYLTNAGDRIVQPVIEIDKGVGSPQLGVQFLTSNNLAGTFHQ